MRTQNFRGILTLVGLALASPLAAQDHAEHMAAGLLHPNTATEAQLRGVPGLAPVVPAILAQRPFARQAEFHAVVAAKLDSTQTVEVYRHLFVTLDPNTASDEEILTIPGVGRRMLREFKEYRPWRAVAQFEREIGKYVDAKEVARLQQYLKIEG